MDVDVRLQGVSGDVQRMMYMICTNINSSRATKQSSSFQLGTYIPVMALGGGGGGIMPPGGGGGAGNDGGGGGSVMVRLNLKSVLSRAGAGAHGVRV